MTNDRTHKAKAACTCDACSNDWLIGCKNPNKCAQTALTILNKLQPKFNPNTSPKKDDLTLTHRRKEKNSQARRARESLHLYQQTTVTRTYSYET
jgi:hypothetical protein